MLFSGLLPGESLRKGHLIGAVCGFLGAALIIQGGSGGFNAEALPGYLLALACALTWSGYSVMSRRLGNAPTDTVAVFCVATAILSALMHLVDRRHRLARKAPSAGPPQSRLASAPLGWRSMSGISG